MHKILYAKNAVILSSALTAQDVVGHAFLVGANLPREMEAKQLTAYCLMHSPVWPAVTLLFLEPLISLMPEATLGALVLVVNPNIFSPTEKLKNAPLTRAAK